MREGLCISCTPSLDTLPCAPRWHETWLEQWYRNMSISAHFAPCVCKWHGGHSSRLLETDHLDRKGTIFCLEDHAIVVEELHSERVVVEEEQLQATERSWQGVGRFASAALCTSGTTVVPDGTQAEAVGWH